MGFIVCLRRRTAGVLHAAALTAAVLTWTGCGGEDGSSAPPPPSRASAAPAAPPPLPDPRPGVRLRVRATDGRRGIAGVEIAVCPLQPKSPRDGSTGTTDALGILDIEGLPAQTYEVRAAGAPAPFAVAEMEADGSRDVSVRVAVEDGRTAHAELVLKAEATFRVAVEGTDAASLGNEAVRAVAVRHLFPDATWRYLPRAPSVRVLSGPSEKPLRVEVTGVPAGRYRLSSAVRGRTRSWVDATARREHVTDVTVDAAGRGLGLELVWTGGDAAAHVGAAFNLNSAEARQGPLVQYGAIGAEGPGTVTGLEPVEYVLFVWQGSWCRRIVKDVTPMQRVAMEAPPAPSSGGGRRVRVHVGRGGKPLGGAFVVLVPAGSNAVPTDAWTRFASSPAEFVGVPADALDVLVIDGVLGVAADPTFGRVARPLPAGTEDVTVNVDL